MKLLLKFVKPYVKYVVALMVLYAVQTLCGLFLPYVMSDIVELGVRTGNLPYIYVRGAVMIALAAAAMITSLVNVRLSADFSSRLTADMRSQIFDKVNSLTFEQFSSVGTGSLITRSTDDIGWLEEVITSLPYLLISAPIMFVGGILLSFKGDWVLPLILLGISAAVLVVTAVVSLRLDKYWERGDQLTDQQNRIMRERLGGIRVVRAFDRENYEHGRVAAATTEMNNCYVRNNTIGGLVNPLAGLALNLATVAIVYVGAVRLQRVETLRAGDIIATIQYIALIVNAVLVVSWSISSVPRVKVSLGRIAEVMNMPVEESKTVDKTKLGGAIEFSGVSFAYPDSRVNSLSDIDFCAEEGQIVGVIGGTGSGKTTLVKLLLGFYPCSGVRKLGGVDYDQATVGVVRDNMSVALQRATMFEGTIADNVRMGNRDADDKQVAEALGVAQMAGFIAEHEEGLQYMLTPDGTNVSGGQKQRINIARAIVKDASVYIFDDSFSALDFLTESNLRRALNARLQGKTQVIVTQRAATAMRCDKVYVLDCGRVVGRGTHEELLENCNTYREICDSQLGKGYFETHCKGGERHE